LFLEFEALFQFETDCVVQSVPNGGHRSVSNVCFKLTEKAIMKNYLKCIQYFYYYGIYVQFFFWGYSFLVYVRDCTNLFSYFVVIWNMWIYGMVACYNYNQCVHVSKKNRKTKYLFKNQNRRLLGTLIKILQGFSCVWKLDYNFINYCFQILFNCGALKMIKMRFS